MEDAAEGTLLRASMEHARAAADHYGERSWSAAAPRPYLRNGSARARHGGLVAPPTGAARQTLEGHTSSVITMAVLGDKLVTGSFDQTLRVLGMRRGAEAWECERVLHDHTSAVTAVACTRDGRRMLSCDTNLQMKVWEEPE